jgi:predicted O-methyltransferase YrrM
MRALTSLITYKLRLRDAETQTTFAERACMAKHAAGKKRLVEVGVWHGVTTRLLRSVMDPAGVYFAIDPYVTGRLGFSIPFHIAVSETAKAPNGRLEWMRMRGDEAARDHGARSEAPVDFVFIDGDHSFEGLRADWEAWSGRVRPGGLVALHDSLSSPATPIGDAGSVVYTREVVHRDARFTRVETVDSLSVYRRNEAG